MSRLQSWSRTAARFCSIMSQSSRIFRRGSLCKEPGRIGLLALFLLFPGCATMHPFSDMPGSRGKIDTSPKVLILRGQDYVVCTKGEEPKKWTYFIHLQFMPPQEVKVRAYQGEWKTLFGTSLTVNVSGKGKAGHLSYHQTEVKVGERVFELTTILMDCSGVSAGKSWSSADTVNGFVEAVAGS